MPPEMALKLTEQQTKRQVEKLVGKGRQKRPVGQSEMQPVSTWEESKKDESSSWHLMKVSARDLTDAASMMEREM